MVTSLMVSTSLVLRQGLRGSIVRKPRWPASLDDYHDQGMPGCPRQW